MNKQQKNTGENFEKLAESIFNKLIKNPDYEKVEHNIKINGKDGPRQIDVLITSENVGFKFLTIIECKDHNTKISVGTIDAFHSKLLDIKANKGVLISKKGFSSTSISKAKRLGITLCTAHEALKDDWDPKIDLPIIIEEETPTDVNFSFTAYMEKGDIIDSNKSPIVNNVDLFKLIEKKWEEGSLKYSDTTNLQEIILEEITPPYNLEIEGERNYVKIIESFTLLLKISKKYFKTKLSDIEGTEILNNVTESNTKIFLKIPSVHDLSNEFKKINKSELKQFSGLILSVRVIPNIKTDPNSFQFKYN